MGLPGHSCLHREFKAGQGYMILCLNTKELTGKPTIETESASSTCVYFGTEKKKIEGAQGKPQTSLCKEELWAKNSKIPLP